jgi:hypothetical protein
LAALPANECDFPYQVVIRVTEESEIVTRHGASREQAMRQAIRRAGNSFPKMVTPIVERIVVALGAVEAPSEALVESAV